MYILIRTNRCLPISAFGSLGTSYGHLTVAVVVLGVSMIACYVDESGDTRSLISSNVDIIPALVIAGIAFSHDHLHDLTFEFLQLKKNMFPRYFSTTRNFLDYIKKEIKGAAIRKVIAQGNRNERRHHLRFLDEFFNLLEKYEVKVFGRVWIKQIGRHINGRSIYTSSVQDICRHYQHFLSSNDKRGFLIADSRDPGNNANVSHSIFTQKFKAQGGDSYNRLIEIPAFGHSENHAGLQIADLLCSAIILPISINTYCTGYISNIHVRPGYIHIKDRYKQRLSKLQYGYIDDSGKPRGGLVVYDPIAQRSGSHLFA